MSAIFHIIRKGDWEKAKEQGSYSPPSLDSEGFIHCSQADQVFNIGRSLYKNCDDLLILRIIESKVTAKVVHEPPREVPMSGLIFPHIYGPLNLDAVEEAIHWGPPDKNIKLFKPV